MGSPLEITAFNNTTSEDIVNYSQYNDTGFPFERPAEWGFWMKFVLTPVIVLAGLIGNTLSFIVMKSKTLRHKSYSHYLSALAIFDTLTLLIRQVHTVDEFYSRNGANEIFRHFDDFGCKIFYFLEHIFYLMSHWLIVLMAVERLIAVCMPFKKVAIRKQLGATLTITAMFISVCLSQVFRLIMVEHLSFSETCGANDDYLDIYTSLHVYLYQWTLAFVLPVGLVLSCNLIVLYQIFKVKRDLKKKDRRNRQCRQARKNNKTTCMLLTVSFTFIGTLLPLLTLTLVLEISVKRLGRDAYTLYKMLMPYMEAFEALSLVNYAVNFYIYILSGRSFRYEMCRVFNRRGTTKRSFTGRSTRTREEVIRL
ncbi:hypothetical protein ACF0H5_024031 [Mactra antiquata]